MNKIFEFVQHIGRWRVLVGTKDISNKAITRQKLSDELWKAIGRMASNELLVCVRDVTTYEEAQDAYNDQKVLVGVDNGLYYLMAKQESGVFYFVQLSEDGKLTVLTLSKNGWSEPVSKELAEGNVIMDILNVDDIMVDDVTIEERPVDVDWE